MLDITNPRQTVIVSTSADMEYFGKNVHKDNLITLSWHTPISADPMLYGILVRKERYSFQMIVKSRCFVVNFMSIDHKDEVMFCGSNSGEHIDKFKETGLTKEDGRKVDCVRIKEALAYMECELVDEVELGDHVLLVGKVLCKDIKKKGARIFHTTSGFVGLS